ncbi:MAG: winged helix-turn-helix transcriptional regulator [Verrucomicrobia bacterium]|nr:winged helix-turn-helix transcriptional regulator [Verrucomicrobiota bacterium]
MADEVPESKPAPSAPSPTPPLSRGQRMEVLAMLKRTGGLAVRALADRMGMSYMGVKQYCLELEKQGFLEVRRVPPGKGRIGRPELVYRLTPKAHSLFPSAANDLTLELLEAVQRTYGVSAPEKLLYTVFHRRAEAYAEMIEETGARSLPERVVAFSKLRDEEGCMSHVDGLAKHLAKAIPPPPTGTAENGAEGELMLRFEEPAAEEAATETPSQVSIIEHRSPIADLLNRYPIVARLEKEMFERVLRVPIVRRDESTDSEHYRVVFALQSR